MRRTSGAKATFTVHDCLPPPGMPALDHWGLVRVGQNSAPNLPLGGECFRWGRGALMAPGPGSCLRCWSALLPDHSGTGEPVLAGRHEARVRAVGPNVKGRPFVH